MLARIRAGKLKNKSETDAKTEHTGNESEDDGGNSQGDYALFRLANELQQPGAVLGSQRREGYQRRKDDALVGGEYGKINDVEKQKREAHHGGCKLPASVGIGHDDVHKTESPVAEQPLRKHEEQGCECKEYKDFHFR